MHLRKFPSMLHSLHHPSRPSGSLYSWSSALSTKNRPGYHLQPRRRHMSFQVLWAQWPPHIVEDTDQVKVDAMPCLLILNDSVKSTLGKLFYLNEITCQNKLRMAAISFQTSGWNGVSLVSTLQCSLQNLIIWLKGLFHYTYWWAQRKKIEVG